jgi:hypothetical protein
MGIGLKTKFNAKGVPVVSSKSAVHVAVEDIAALDAEIAKLAGPLEAQRTLLKEAVDKYVIKTFEPSNGYEDETISLTHVQSHTRKWNAEKLEQLVPRGIFKNLVTVTVVPAKIDEYVRAKKIKREDIEPAFEEVPKAPYVKWTPKKASQDGRAEDEAAGLAASLKT